MISIRGQCWNRVSEEHGFCSAEDAASYLRSCGYDVRVIDGDWGCSYFADTEEEHDAIRALPDV